MTNRISKLSTPSLRPATLKVCCVISPVFSRKAIANSANSALQLSGWPKPSSDLESDKRMAKRSTFTNADRVLKRLRKLGDLAKAETLRTAATSGAEAFIDIARDRVPYVSGDLHDSIEDDIVEERDGYVETQIGSDLPYAARIEFGYTDTDALGRTYDQAAQPYLRPAYDDGKKQALDNVKTTLLDELDRLKVS